jgi:hypothetical protein
VRFWNIKVRKSRNDAAPPGHLAGCGVHRNLTIPMSAQAVAFPFMLTANSSDPAFHEPRPLRRRLVERGDAGNPRVPGALGDTARARAH